MIKQAIQNLVSGKSLSISPVRPEPVEGRSRGSLQRVQGVLRLACPESAEGLSMNGLKNVSSHHSNGKPKVLAVRELKKRAKV